MHTRYGHNYYGVPLMWTYQTVLFICEFVTNLQCQFIIFTCTGPL